MKIECKITNSDLFIYINDKNCYGNIKIKGEKFKNIFVYIEDMYEYSIVDLLFIYHNLIEENKKEKVILMTNDKKSSIMAYYTRYFDYFICNLCKFNNFFDFENEISNYYQNYDNKLN